MTIFALHDLTELMRTRLEAHSILVIVNPTRLKLAVMENFPDFTEEKGIRNRVFFLCSKTARNIVSDAIQTPEEKLRKLLLAASILRKAVVDHETKFTFKGSFPEECEESAVPSEIQYFFRHLLEGPKCSLSDNNSRRVLSVSQVAMFNMTCLLEIRTLNHHFRCFWLITYTLTQEAKILSNFSTNTV